MIQMLEELKPMLAKYKGERGVLIPVLQDIQEKYKYIPPDSVAVISKELRIPVTKINGVITFYAQFRSEPVGKYIVRICNGTACFVNNSESISDTLKEALKIDVDETTEDKLFTLEKVACLGCCSLAPVIMINDKVFGKLDSTKVKKIIEKYKKEQPDE